MRAWIAACAVLVVACALVLWRSLATPAAVAPVAAAGGPVAREDQRAPQPVEDTRVTETSRAAVPDATPAHATTEVQAEPELTRVSLRVLEPNGAPWTNGRLLLAIEAANGISAQLQGQSWLHRGGPISVRGWVGTRDGRSVNESYSDWVTDDEGRVELSGIPPGLAFEVRALDSAKVVGGVHEGAPLSEGEQREETLWLDLTPWPLEGRCVDPDGAPLAQVRVTITTEERAEERLTEEDGSFVVSRLFAESIGLSAQRRGFVREVREVALPSPPLELVLERARTLTVTLVDPEGAPFVMHELRAYGLDDDPRVDTFPEVADGAHRFDSMPHVPITLAIEGCGGRPTLEVDAGSAAVRWALQRPGEAHFEWAPSTRELGWTIHFDLVRLDGPDAGPVETRTIPRGQPIPAWTLFPGRYRLAIRANHDDAPLELSPVGVPREFEVRGGETTPVLVGD